MAKTNPMEKPRNGSKSDPMRDTQTFSYGEIIILGFTGSLGSGCSYLAKGLKDSLPDARYFRLSDVLRERLREQGVDHPSTEQLQEEGNNLREEQGVSVLVQLCLQKLSAEGNSHPFTRETVALIDGIRNDGEIRCLRAFSHFYLISVHADEGIREGRLVGPGKKFADKADFEKADVRDQEEDVEYGQKVKRCNYLADIIIQNNKRFTNASQKKDEFFSSFKDNYIKTIRAVRKGQTVPDHPPAVQETLMTMAYCLSKRSSCEKRSVGAVIANVIEHGKLKDVVKRKEDYIQFQVIAVGYNEVPLGTDPCKLGEFERCYRDRLKQNFVENLKYCPNCGAGIPSEHHSNAKSLAEYNCVECQSSIAQKYMPGTSELTGRLLDMCRALHAEEIAIIGLAGIPKPARGKLVLYTTTFPCNLCANKIVTAGIDEVRYAESYSMRESKEILEAADIDVVQFEGVKSTAYFRLYS